MTDNTQQARAAVTPEAIEAAARHMHDDEGYFEAFEDAPEFRKEHFREKAAGILEAAAQHMLAAAWQAGHTAGDGDQSAMWDARNAGKPAKYADIATPNPYRSNRG
jgi:hypothetical protein